MLIFTDWIREIFFSLALILGNVELYAARDRDKWHRYVYTENLSVNKTFDIGYPVGSIAIKVINDVWNCTELG